MFVSETVDHIKVSGQLCIIQWLWSVHWHLLVLSALIYRGLLMWSGYQNADASNADYSRVYSVEIGLSGGKIELKSPWLLLICSKERERRTLPPCLNIEGLWLIIPLKWRNLGPAFKWILSAYSSQRFSLTDRHLNIYSFLLATVI